MNISDPAILATLGRQHGAATRAQLIGLGVHRRAVSRALKDRQLIPVLPGVYRSAATPVSAEMRLTAARLAVPDGVFSHRSAAWLHGLAGFGSLDTIEVSTSGRARAKGVVVHRKELSRFDLTAVRGFRATQVGRTLLDLCEVCDAGPVTRALDDALRRKLVSHRVLERLYLGREGHRGMRLLHALLAERGPEDARCASELETRFLQLLRRSRLRLPDAINVDVRDDQGDLVARPDFGWRAPPIAVFLDGRSYHSDAVTFEKDRAQANALVSAGWRVLRYTWRQLEEGTAVVRDLTSALAAPR